MKLLFTAFCFLLVLPLTAQADLGTGLISIHFDNKTIVCFYNSPADTQPAQTIEFFDDLRINSWNIKQLEEHKKWLNPEVLWLDYDHFIFRCLKEEKGFFQVIVNNETGKSYWIKKSTLTKFSTWEQFLKEMFSIERLDKATPIKNQPAANAKTIDYKGNDCFQAKQMRGDWIEIFSTDYCDYEAATPKLRSGWIQWKRGNKLSIDYHLTS